MEQIMATDLELDEELYTEPELAGKLKCSFATLRKKRSDGTGIPFYKIPGVGIRYGARDVENFIKLHRVSTRTGTDEE